MWVRFPVGATSFLAEKGGLIHEYDLSSTPNNVYVQFKNMHPFWFELAPNNTMLCHVPSHLHHCNILSEQLCYKYRLSSTPKNDFF